MMAATAKGRRIERLAATPKEETVMALE